MSWTSPRTWSDNELVGASIMNPHVRDNFLYLYGLAGPSYALEGRMGSGSGATFSPSASTSYYIGVQASSSPNPSTTAAIAKIYIPKAGRLTCARITIRVAGTLSSNHTSTVSVRLNNTTDTTLSASVKADATEQTYSTSALSITVAEGDYVELKWATPAWTTTPTDVNVSYQLFVEP